MVSKCNLHRSTSLAKLHKSVESHGCKSRVTNLSIIPHILGILTTTIIYCIMFLDHVNEPQMNAFVVQIASIPTRFYEQCLCLVVGSVHTPIAMVGVISAAAYLIVVGAWMCLVPPSYDVYDAWFWSKRIEGVHRNANESSSLFFFYLMTIKDCIIS